VKGENEMSTDNKQPLDVKLTAGENATEATLDELSNGKGDEDNEQQPIG
jgi:hypothetical protein